MSCRRCRRRRHRQWAGSRRGGRSRRREGRRCGIELFLRISVVLAVVSQRKWRGAQESLLSLPVPYQAHLRAKLLLAGLRGVHVGEILLSLAAVVANLEGIKTPLSPASLGEWNIPFSPDLACLRPA